MAVAAMMLELGIGANTAIYTVVYAVSRPPQKNRFDEIFYCHPIGQRVL